MEYSSAITERMCKEVLYTLSDIAMEQEKHLEQTPGASEFRVGDMLGKFQMIYN